MTVISDHLLRFSGGPDFSASIIGQILYGERVHGETALARLRTAFLNRLVIRPGYQNCLIKIPGLAARPWWEPNEVSLAADLEAAWPDVEHELSHGLALTQLQPYRQANSDFLDKEHWLTTNLFIPGWPEREDARLFPRTLSFLKPRSELAEVVAISRLEPGGHIKPHCGPWNARLMIHWGISIPDSCSMRVGCETRSWKTGRCLVFDDSFEHECWNNSGQSRSILLLNVWHPELTEVERAVLTSISRIRGGVYWNQQKHLSSERRGAKPLAEFETFVVAHNGDGLMSIWPSELEGPGGWRTVHAALPIEGCLEWINSNSPQ